MPANIHRDFATTIESLWIAEDSKQPGYFFITATGEAAVNSGFVKTKPRYKSKKEG